MKKFKKFISTQTAKFVGNRSTGVWGESQASRFLKRNNYLIWDKNWRCPIGELDLVASKERTLIFVEVKTRNVKHTGEFPILNSISNEKKKRLEILASYYQRDHYRKIRKNRIKEQKIIYVYISFTKERFRRKIETIMQSSDLE